MTQEAGVKGKRESEAYGKQRKNNKPIPVALICIIIFLIGMLVFHWVWKSQMAGKSIYAQIVSDGYSGTQEQWLASIAGEESGADNVKSAYELACENGYRKTEGIWILTLTGYESADQGERPYEVACRNGYDGSLAQWMESIADEPEQLGISEENETKTEYELACEYGYTGTFIEWLISVTTERVF